MEQSTIDEHGLPGIENSDNDGITAATKTTTNKKVPIFTDLMKEIYEKSDNIKIIILELHKLLTNPEAVFKNRVETLKIFEKIQKYVEENDVCKCKYCEIKNNIEIKKLWLFL